MSMINWPARFAEMVDFVGLSEEDRQLIKASAPIILARADHLNDFVYDQLLEYPQARQFFVTDNDEPDEKRIEANKQTMLSWLRATVAAPFAALSAALNPLAPACGERARVRGGHSDQRWSIPPPLILTFSP